MFAKKGPARYRSYQSWVIAQGCKHEAGSVPRVAAEDIEQAVIAVIRARLAQKDYPDAAIEDVKLLIRTHVAKAVIGSEQLGITLQPPADKASSLDRGELEDPRPETLAVPWSRPAAVRHREILRAEDAPVSVRPIRNEARTRLIIAIARGRRWLDQIMDGAASDLAAIASREDLSEKTIRSVISLAFLAPDIIQAAVDGRLPRGFGVSQLTGLPMAWSAQR